MGENKKKSTGEGRKRSGSALYRKKKPTNEKKEKEKKMKKMKKSPVK